MTSRGRSGVAAAALVWLCAVGLPAAGDDTPAPYDVALRVAYEGPGFDAYREEIELRVVARLDAEACFAHLSILDPDADPALAAAALGADLLLDVVLTDIEDEVEYDISMAERNAPDAPPDRARRQTARIEIAAGVELRTVDPAGVVVRDQRVSVRRSHRPNFDEDPRTEALLGAVDELSRAVARLVCKVSARKLSREIERAVRRPTGER